MPSTQTLQDLFVEDWFSKENCSNKRLQAVPCPQLSCDAAGQGAGHLCQVHVFCALQGTSSAVVTVCSLTGSRQESCFASLFFWKAVSSAFGQRLGLEGRQEGFACLLFWRKFMFWASCGRSGFLASHSAPYRTKEAFVQFRLLSAGINKDCQPPNVNFLTEEFYVQTVEQFGYLA